jgi:hypothetical protein
MAKRRKPPRWKRNGPRPGTPVNGPTAKALERLKKEAFLDAYGKLGTITGAAQVAEVGRGQHYVWANRDPAYAAAFLDKQEEARERLEQEARRRAVAGVLKPIFHDGKKIAEVTEYSDTLLIFLLKGAYPEKYRDRFEVTGKGGGPIVLTTEERRVLGDALKDPAIRAALDGLAARLARLGGGPGGDGRDAAPRALAAGGPSASPEPTAE